MRQTTLFSLVLCNGLYLISIAMSASFIWNLYWVIETTTHSFDLSSIIEIAGSVMAILLMITSMIAGWSLFKENRYKLAITISMAPMFLYFMITALPQIFW